MIRMTSNDFIFHLSDRSSFFCIIFNWTWYCSSCIFSWAATWNGWFCSFTRIRDECQTSHVLEFSLGKKTHLLKSHASEKDIKMPCSLRIYDIWTLMSNLISFWEALHFRRLIRMMYSVIYMFHRIFWWSIFIEWRRSWCLDPWNRTGSKNST